MIEIKNLAKAFDGRTVLNDINAVFETGKTNLIIGRSGSGKTVMLKSIIGLIRPDEGEVLYDGRNIIRMSKTELNLLRRKTGILFSRLGTLRQHDGARKRDVSARHVLKRNSPRT